MNAIRDISSHEKVKRTNKKDCLSSKVLREQDESLFDNDFSDFNFNSL